MYGTKSNIGIHFAYTHLRYSSMNECTYDMNISFDHLSQHVLGSGLRFRYAFEYFENKWKFASLMGKSLDQIISIHL